LSKRRGPDPQRWEGIVNDDEPTRYLFARLLRKGGPTESAAGDAYVEMPIDEVELITTVRLVLGERRMVKAGPDP
jgi:hypothetical protein